MPPDAHFPALLLALGPPPSWPADRTGTFMEYEREFIEFCLRADVLGMSGPDSTRYPLSIPEKTTKYREVLTEFIWWYRGDFRK